jgi:seryl-tRNA synthetase
LRYKEFITLAGNKVFVHFKDYGGTKNCEINFETNESFSDKDLNDSDILKNVLFVVLKEVNSKKYDIIDFELGNKITGAGFPVYKGKGARIQRALINFFLDEAIAAGYAEVQPSILAHA